MVRIKTTVDYSYVKLAVLLFAVYAFANGVQYAGIIAAFVFGDLVLDKENSNKLVVAVYEVVSFVTVVGTVAYSFMG
jgi:NhaP-type Na+/H+ or K+/H+ antiporter